MLTICRTLIASDTSLTGVTVGGDNNNISLDGGLNIDVSDQSAGSRQYLNVVGLNVTGDGNSVAIDGGINITHSEYGDIDDVLIHGIDINGNSEATLSGHSTVDTATLSGGNVVLAQVKMAAHWFWMTAQLLILMPNMWIRSISPQMPC